MGGSFEVARADEMIVGASRKSDPNIQGIDGLPRVLPMESNVEDNNEEKLCEAMGNARPKGWGSSAVVCWAPLVLAKISGAYPVYQRESVNTVCFSHLPMSGQGRNSQ